MQVLEAAYLLAFVSKGSLIGAATFALFSYYRGGLDSNKTPYMYKLGQHNVLSVRTRNCSFQGHRRPFAGYPTLQVRTHKKSGKDRSASLKVLATAAPQEGSEPFP